MSSPLVTDSMMARLRKIAGRQLVTPMTIQRQIQVETDYGTNTSYQTVLKLRGWLQMTNKPNLIEQTGEIGATSIFRLNLPQGTDIREGDQVILDSQGLKYVVNDVNTDDTVQVYTTALVQRIQ